MLATTLSAQETNVNNDENKQGTTIYLDQQNKDSVTAKDGKMSLTLAGINFDFAGKSDSVIEAKKGRVNYTFAGASINSRSYSHLALIELGSNFLVNSDYSMYSPEDANAMQFTNRKSIYCAINLMSMDVQFNPKRTLGLTVGFGFATENYAFANKYTMEYRDGMMYPVALDDSIKKSKLLASYIHIPVLLDWNIAKGIFISAGVNVDILMNSQLKYKKPKTTIDGIATLNPFQVGITARVGWNKLYGFVNYSLLDMYKQNTGPSAHRMSAGVGLFF